MKRIVALTLLLPISLNAGFASTTRTYASKHAQTIGGGCAVTALLVYAWGHFSSRNEGIKRRQELLAAQKKIMDQQLPKKLSIHDTKCLIALRAKQYDGGIQLEDLRKNSIRNKALREELMPLHLNYCYNYNQALPRRDLNTPVILKLQKNPVYKRIDAILTYYQTLKDKEKAYKNWAYDSTIVTNFYSCLGACIGLIGAAFYLNR